jgi:CRP/FNR family transcriptional regulator, cyclic AMP receptor protein
MPTHKLSDYRYTIEKRALLHAHPIFGALPRTLIEALAAKATVRAFRRDTTIFSKGDEGTGLYAVMSGTVKISSSSIDGREAVFNLIHVSEIFGEIALLDGRSRTADAVAMTDCSLMMIDRRDFIPIVREQPEVAIKLVELLCARLRWTSEQYEEMMFLDFPGRLAKTLLRLTEKIGGTSGQRDVAITQREISNFLGRSRETTNKQLRAWARQGVVALKRGRVVVLAPQALAAIATPGFEPCDPDERVVADGAGGSRAAWAR